MPTLPTMFIVAGPSGAREELLAPRAGCEAVEVMEATAMGSTLGPGLKDMLVPSTGLPRSWFSVSGWGWFTWNGLAGPEAAAAPGREQEGQWVIRAHLPQGRRLVRPGPCWAAEPPAHRDTSAYGTSLHCLDEKPSDLSKVTA